MDKDKYLEVIRECSSYPKFRLGITVLTVLMYIGCAFQTFFSIMTFKVSAVLGLVGLLGCGIVAFLVIPFLREGMEMGVDFVDSLLDKNSQDKN